MEAEMSSNHILDIHDNLLHNCFIKRALKKIQPDFAVIAPFTPLSRIPAIFRDKMRKHIGVDIRI